MDDEDDVKEKRTRTVVYSSFLQTGRLLLAPMVRIGTLPFRLLALRYGADLVFSEEIIDIKLLKTKRIENKILDTIEYVLDDGTVVYQTCMEESGKNVIQIGSSCPERAALVVKHVCRDVAAIDLNMGCPKSFSIKGGMGSALLRNKENAKKILQAMVQNSSVPVTCKIRILPTLEETLEIARIAQGCGVAALTVHGRTPSNSPSDANNEEIIALVARTLDIPVIANGGSLVIKTRNDAVSFKERTGTCSVMLARCALENPSIFRHDPCSMEILAREFVELAACYALPFHLVKYTLPQLISNWQPRKTSSADDASVMENRRLEWLNISINSDDMAQILNVFGFSNEFVAEYNSRVKEINEMWRVKSDADNIICMPVDGDQKTLMVSGGDSPRELLTLFCKRRNLPPPIYYSTEREDRRFYSIVTVNGRQFSSGRIEQRKKVCEQAAAMAALIYMDAFT